MSTIPQPLANPQQGSMSEQAPGTNITSAGPTLADLMRQFGGPINTAGLTQVVSAGQPQPPASQQTTPPMRQQVQQFGVGGAGAARRQDSQNMAIAAHNLAQNIGQKVEARKQRQYQQVTDQYTGFVRGISEAQGQIQQGQQMVTQAQQRLQANPDDAEAKQTLQMGAQLIRQGQGALQQNQTNIDDLANDPKRHKIILKAFGIDDKNANTPERQAAIQSVRKQMGVGPNAANLISRMPARQQLSPQGAAQAEAVKAGIASRPATQGQQLQAATTIVKTGMQEEGKNVRLAQTEQGRDWRAELRTSLAAQLQGLKPDENNPGKFVPMTPEEIKQDPVLQAKQDVLTARATNQKAQAEYAKVRASNDAKRIAIAQRNASTAAGNLALKTQEFAFKVQTTPVYAYDTKQNKTVLTTLAGASSAGMTGVRQVKQTDIAKDAHDIRVLNDVAVKANNVAQSASAMDNTDWSDTIEAARYLTSHPDATVSSMVNSGVLKDMSPKAKDYTISVLNLRESSMGLQKVLSGSARSNETQLNALLATLPGLEPDAATVRQKLGAFTQNITMLRQGVPDLPGMTESELKGMGAPLAAPDDALPSDDEILKMLNKK